MGWFSLPCYHGLIRLEERRQSHVLIASKKEDRRIAGRKKASAIARPFPGKKNRSCNRPNGLTETDQFSAGKKEDRRSAYGHWDAITKDEVDEKKNYTTKENVLLEVSKHKNVKDVWESIRVRYLGADRVQKARLQTLRNELERLKMKDDESINDFAGKISGIVAKSKSLGSILEEEVSVRKFLNSLPKKYLPIVAPIEQYSDLATMPFEEAVGRVKAYEERIQSLEAHDDEQGKLLMNSIVWAKLIMSNRIQVYRPWCRWNPTILGESYITGRAILKRKSFSLYGTIPDSLYNLSLLTNISLGDNQLTGSLHPAIGGMLPRLVDLQLRDNQLSGPLPPSICNCSRLRYFEVAVNKFSGKLIFDFSKLRDVYFLNLHDNLFGSNDPDEMKFIDSMKNCSKLLKLDLGDCNFQGVIPASIGNLSSQLNFLRLQGNQLHGNLPTSIGNLVGLEMLSFGVNQFAGSIPSTIGNLPNLGALYLSDNQLSGQIPDAMGNLSSLIKLYLSSNMLEGAIPSSLGNCHHLLDLYIDDNRLNGKIPTKLLQLSSLSITLNLSKNNLFGSLPKEVGELKMLSSLDLSYNNLSGVIPISLGDCGSLLRLSLKGNLFQGTIPSSLSSLKGLLELDISHNNLSGQIPKFLQYLKFEHVNLSYNDFEGEIPMVGVFANEAEVVKEIRKEANIKTIIEECVASTVKIGVSCSMDSPTQRMDMKNVIDISNNELVGSIPKEISFLSNLTLLSLFNNKLTGGIPPFLGNLTSLEEFSVKGNPFGGSIPQTLGHLKSLKEIYLGTCNLSGIIPDSLYNLSLLTNLSLAENQLTGSLHTAIGGMLPRLVFLQLRDNQLTGPLPSSISNCSRLRIFEAAANKFSGKLKIDFSKLRDIYFISVSKNNFGSKDPDEMNFIDSLKNCTKLLTLDLLDCKFQGVIPWSIGNLSSQLNFLNLYGNQLHGNLPTSIGNLVGLETLSLRGVIPVGLGDCVSLLRLSLQGNLFQGEVPTLGVFTNKSAFFVMGNNRLCGGIVELGLPKCKTKKYAKNIGASLNKHLRKEEVILRKQHCFRRITGSCRRLYKTTASEESSYALKTKTSEVYPLTKTVADYSYGTKGTDTRHVGLSKDRYNM
ncbi:hypothetical protein E3N88_13195 [Mikania micrantha]|uniref:non-specific serine/threonine protein kinase n=1 Tax=Mikania micrantha TaxID=192012 RepID=A0A5N6PAL3_9ASTR|nr:hypothetical protein E3N88_13195 [Mikania micrantha]